MNRSADPSLGPLAEARLTVLGMHSGNCSKRVEALLLAIDGIDSASVSLSTREARIHYDPNWLTPRKAAHVLADEGFEAEEITATVTDRATEEAEAERERRDRRLRFWGGIGLTATLLCVTFSGITFEGRGGIRFCLAAAVVFWTGAGFWTGAWRALRHFRADSNTLVVLSSAAALACSLIAGLAPSLWEGSGVYPGTYYEIAAGLILTGFLGRTLETRARGRATEAVRRLIRLQPDFALVVRGGAETEIPVDEVAVGDRVRIRAGDSVPVDGTIHEGHGAFDESMLSGEATPVEKIPGDSVFSGTISTSGLVDVIAEHVNEDTVLRKIITLVQAAQAAKPPVGRMAERLCGRTVWVCLVIALVAGLGWFFLGPPPGLPLATIAFFSVLIMACPAAIGLATPAAVLAATRAATDKGITIRSGSALEAAYTMDALAVDKTGTLTEGCPQVIDIAAGGYFSEARLLTLASSALFGSDHAYGDAIVERARAAGIEVEEPDHFLSLDGFGVEASVDGRVVVVGGSSLIAQRGIEFGVLTAKLDEYTYLGKTSVLVAVDGRPAGVFSLADRVRDGVREALEAIRDLGIDVIMLTGDNAAAAQKTARETGIETVLAEVLPENKAEQIEALQANGHRVGMVGDGVNDAPALARADVSFAMGYGADIAVEASDVTITKGELASIPEAIHLSAATVQTIRGNLRFAILFNALTIPLASGILYPFTKLLLTPAIAASALALGLIVTLVNCLRLRRFV